MNTKKTICFIANFSKTYFFHAIAEELARYNTTVYWITSNQKLYNFLIEAYGEDAVLLINRDTPRNEPIDDFKLNELVFGDRVLRHDVENGLSFLRNIQVPIYKFLKENKVRFVFGEITWSQEILIHRICSKRKELNCTFLNPHVVRIPNDRFAFFTDEVQATFFEVNKEYPVTNLKLEVKKPTYLKINDGRLKKANSILGRLDRIRRWITNENIDKKDPTLLHKGIARLKTRTQEESNKEIYKFVKRKTFEEVNNAPYIFVGLHKQPEASVDVFGRYYEDQALNIVNLWRALPEGWNLLVKEHTNAIGDRSLRFYKDLQALPNIYFVNEKTDSYQLIRNAKAVATITGTIAYEAALMQVPALTFAKVFFNKLNHCKRITIEELKNCENLKIIIDALEKKEDNRTDFSNYILHNTFEGTFSDPISNESIMQKDNVQLVSAAFLNVMNVVNDKILERV